MMRLAYIQDGLRNCSMDASWNCYFPLGRKEIILLCFIPFSVSDPWPQSNTVFWGFLILEQGQWPLPVPWAMCAFLPGHSSPEMPYARMLFLKCIWLAWKNFAVMNFFLSGKCKCLVVALQKRLFSNCFSCDHKQNDKRFSFLTIQILPSPLRLKIKLYLTSQVRHTFF